MESIYRLMFPHRRHKKHHVLSKIGKLLDNYRPNINLCSNKQVKFKDRRGNMQKFLKSPKSHGIKIWDRIPQEIQQATTKVNNLRLLADC